MLDCAQGSLLAAFWGVWGIIDSSREGTGVSLREDKHLSPYINSLASKALFLASEGHSASRVSQGQMETELESRA